MQAGDLHCPSCGAAVSSGASQCKYCKALLKTVACPKCLGMMFMGCKFCEHCGARAEKLEFVKSSTGRCPRCEGQLRARQLGDLSLESCDLCSGIWLGIKAFDQICNQQAARTAASGFRPAVTELKVEKVKYIKCPQCQNIMNRLNYAGGSGVIIDVCRQHGVWLDKDEMPHIIDFIQSGGLDRQRQKESETLQNERKKLDRDRQISSQVGAMTDPVMTGNGDWVSSGIEMICDLIGYWFRHH